MKKICISIIVILGVVFSANIKVDASEVQVNVGVIGEVKAGSNVEIVVDLQKMSNLYAASMDYTYDNSFINVEDIVVSSNINNGSTHEAYNDTASGGNKARYGYTNMGDSTGFSGDTNFLIIKAKVLKDGELNLTKDNFKVKLVQKQGSISEMLCNVNYPKESWELVKDPTGGTATITYTRIEAKANSLSSTSLSGDNASAVVPGDKTSEVSGVVQATAEGKNDAATEATTNNDVSQAEEYQDKDETSNYWIAGVIVVALIIGGGFFVYKRKSSVGEQSPIEK